jgi:hypothetical protein
MGKLDKKVLKVIASQEDMDYDVGDISIALKCDDEEVQDALDSLSDQGLIEAVIHNGKKFWKPAQTDTYSSEIEPVKASQTKRDGSSVDLLILDQPAKSPRYQEPSRYQQDREYSPASGSFEEAAYRRTHEQVLQKPLSTARPIQRTFENEIIDDNTVIYDPPAKFKPTPVIDDSDDDEFDKPRNAPISIGSIVIAVVLSAGISALIAMAFVNNETKGFAGSIAALESKVTETSAKTGQRIDALSVAIDNIRKDLAAAAQPPVVATVQQETKKPPVKTASKQTMKSSSRSTAKKASAKRAAATSKKRKTPAEIIQETSSSASAGDGASSSPAIAPAASSETAGDMSSSPSASEPSSSQASEPAPSPAASEPSASGGAGDGNSPAPSDGSGQ